MIPATLHAVLCDAAGDEIEAAGGAPVSINGTTLPRYGHSGDVLLAPLTWPPADAQWRAATLVRFYAGGDLVAVADIPAACLPPSMPPPRPGEPFDIHSGALVLHFLS